MSENLKEKVLNYIRRVYRWELYQDIGSEGQEACYILERPHYASEFRSFLKAVGQERIVLEDGVFVTLKRGDIVVWFKDRDTWNSFHTREMVSVSDKHRRSIISNKDCKKWFLSMLLNLNWVALPDKDNDDCITLRSYEWDESVIQKLRISLNSRATLVKKVHAELYYSSISLQFDDVGTAMSLILENKLVVDISKAIPSFVAFRRKIDSFLQEFASEAAVVRKAV